MRLVNNNKGIALITALMMTLICLVITMSILYSVTQNIKSSAAHKAYRNSIEASYGGTEIVMNDVLPLLFRNVSTSTIKSNFSTIGFNFLNSNNCIRQKLSSAPTGTNWSLCSDGTDVNPKISPDLSFNLGGTSGQQYTVYSKIVDTIEGADYINPGGVPLLGGGVADSGGGSTGIPPQHFVYRVEVIGEKTANPVEKGSISVLYEY